MTILGIDTSFDDTAAAVVSDSVILSNVLSTDLSIHQEYGGVVPRLARQAHIAHIDPVIRLALKRANVSWNKIDAIAVTRGPGLAITLEIGIAKAKELAKEQKKPLIAVNHMEGHLLSFLCSQKSRTQMKKLPLPLKFPLLGILISGGHTQFVYTEAIGHYEIVGETQDDALGECFDKVGRMLGLGYPAGKMVEQMAKEGIPGKVVFPIPMRQVKSADTSYSGLKTAALRIVEKYPSLTRQDIADIALGFQTAAVQHLIEKLEYALREKNVRSIAVGGGVVCNQFVRKELRSFAKRNALPIFFPFSKKLCTDNAAMIALAAQWNRPINAEEMDRLPVWNLDRLAK